SGHRSRTPAAPTRDLAPEILRRWVTNVLHAASTGPLPIGAFAATGWGGHHRAKRLQQLVPTRQDPNLPQFAVLSHRPDLTPNLASAGAYVVHSGVSYRSPTPQLSVWQLRGAQALHPIERLRWRSRGPRQVQAATPPPAPWG